MNLRSIGLRLTAWYAVILLATFAATGFGAWLELRDSIDDTIAAGGPAEELTFSDLTLNPATREVRRGGRPIDLTRTEFALLEMFLRRPRRVLDRSFILEEVWGYDFPTTANSLEVYVGYLRRKTEAEGEPRLLHTVRGVGYVLKES